MNNYYFEGKFNYLYKETENPQYNENSLHSHELYEILYFESGRGEFILEDGKFMLCAGDIITLPPRTKHCINLISGVTYKRSVINFEKLPFSAKSLFEKPSVISVADNSRIISLFARMKDYSSFFDGEEKQIIVKNLVTELILLLCKATSKREQSFGKNISEAIEYIENNLAEIKDISELCDALHVSRAGLYREFCKELSISPMKYITVKRLERAQNLIRIGENPTKVCFRVGFCDYSAFYKAYKAHFGYTPTKTIHF